MEDSILKFPEQFTYEPKIENADALEKKHKYIVCGMGGSHLSAGLAKHFLPNVEIIVHRDYGLPISGTPASPAGTRLSEYLVVISSYSGNTEEVLDALETARAEGAAVAAITTGGMLLERAREYGIPFVQMPATGIQPRTALGFSFRALLKLMGEESLLKESSALSGALAPRALEEDGEALARMLAGRVPVIYASARNKPLAYNWKIKFNETGKVPSFFNVFPELNHNEMNGFDVTEATKDLARAFHFIILKDTDDHPRIVRRMEILEQQFTERELPVETLTLKGSNALERIFSSLMLADWTALHTARRYGQEPEQVPMIEEFKRKISNQ